MVHDKAILIIFLFPKGVVDGERPLKFPYRKFCSISLPAPKDILRAFQKNKFHYEFNPDTEKLGDIVPPYFSPRCPSGASYEVGFAEGADM
jgi:hypothetical protein